MPATYRGTNHTPVQRGIRVGCANGFYMRAVATDILALPQLPKQARSCHKFTDISIPLISVPKLCEAGCAVDFQQDKVTINNKQGTTLVTGCRDSLWNLYMIDIPSGTPIPLLVKTVARIIFTSRKVKTSKLISHSASNHFF